MYIDDSYAKTVAYLDSIDLAPILTECYKSGSDNFWDVYERICEETRRVTGFCMALEDLIDYLRSRYILYIRESVRYTLQPISPDGVFLKKELSNN